MRWRSARMGSRWRTRPRFVTRGPSRCGWPMRLCRRSLTTATTMRRLPRMHSPSRPSCKTRIPMTAEQRTYESAIERLEAIIRRLDSNEAGLRETLELVTEGRELIEYCAGELDAVGKGLEELKLDDLIARLEAAEPAR